MASTLHTDLEPARPAGAEDEHSIREALRITLLFVAVVMLLLWAGIADAAPASTHEFQLSVPAGAPGPNR